MTGDEPIDLGYLSLPAAVQAEVEAHVGRGHGLPDRAVDPVGFLLAAVPEPLPDVEPLLARLSGQARGPAGWNIQVFTGAECAAIWQHLRVLQFNAESVREELARRREYGEELLRAAGSGVTCAAHVRGRALAYTPAKRALIDEVAGWVEEWSARVLAVEVAPDGARKRRET